MLLEFRNVSSINKKISLANINFAIEPGYIMAIKGRNEAGKSTLFSYILDSKKKYTGDILFEGQNIEKLGNIKFNKISYICDDNELFVSYTIHQNAQIMKIIYDNWDSEFFYTKIKEFGLSESAIYGKLSRGEKIKVQLAFAMAHQTTLYLIDEATAGMDPIFRKEFFRILKEIIKDEKSGILMISHIESEIKQHADYVYTLENGRILYEREEYNEIGEKEEIESKAEEIESKAEEIESKADEIESKAHEIESKEGIEQEKIGTKLDRKAKNENNITNSDKNKQNTCNKESKEKSDQIKTLSEYIKKQEKCNSIGYIVLACFMNIIGVIMMSFTYEEIQREPSMSLPIIYLGIGCVFYMKLFLSIQEFSKKSCIVNKIKYLPVKQKSMILYFIKKSLKYNIKLYVACQTMQLLVALFSKNIDIMYIVYPLAVCMLVFAISIVDILFKCRIND